MKFLLPFIVIGAMLASQVVTAASSVEGTACASRALQRRAERLLKVGRSVTCDPSMPVSRPVRSSSSSSLSSSLPSGTRIGVACPSEGALRRATRLLARGLPAACEPDATSFYGPNALSIPPFVVTPSGVPPAPTVYDQGETTIRTQFLLLGETGPVIGASSLFIEQEPLRVTAISINLQSDVSSIHSLLVYDDDRRYLGRATLNTSTATNRNYRLTIPAGTLTIGKREERHLYFRPQLSSYDAGGRSGTVAQMSDVTVEGNGEWSSESYRVRSSLSDIYPPFTTARSTITSIKNALQAQSPLVVASNQLLGGYVFEGRVSDASAKIELQTLRFQIEKTGDVSLANVQLRTQGLPEGISCTVASDIVTCSQIPAIIGSLTDAPRTLLLSGDISGGTSLHASLRLSLIQAGSPSSAGSVTWTDGSTVFDWVALDDPPVTGANFTY